MAYTYGGGGGSSFGTSTVPKKKKALDYIGSPTIPDGPMNKFEPLAPVAPLPTGNMYSTVTGAPKPEPVTLTMEERKPEMSTTYTPAENKPVTLTMEEHKPQESTTYTPAPMQKDALDEKAKGLGGRALDMVAEGMEKGSEGTRAQIASGNEGIAAAARQAQAQAGAAAAKAGDLGQGSASAAAQQVRSNILSQMGENERQNTKLVSDEKKSFADQALRAGESAQNREIQREQTYNQNKQFYDNLSEQKGDSYMRSMVDFAAQTGNPVLNNKVQNWLLNGGKGNLGPVTPQEKADMQKFIDENQEMDNELKKALMEMMKGLGGTASASANAANAPATTTTAAAPVVQRTGNTPHPSQGRDPIVNALTNAVVNTGKGIRQAGSNVKSGAKTAWDYIF